MASWWVLLPWNDRTAGCRRLWRSCALRSAPHRMFDAERMEGLDSSAQRQRAEVAGTDVGRRSQGGERFRRCDEQASDFAGRLLEAPGRVHDVAMEDDRTAHLADLAGDDFTQVQGRTQLRLQ